MSATIILHENKLSEQIKQDWGKKGGWGIYSQDMGWLGIAVPSCGLHHCARTLLSRESLHHLLIDTVSSPCQAQE